MSASYLPLLAARVLALVCVGLLIAPPLCLTGSKSSIRTKTKNRKNCTSNAQSVNVQSQVTYHWFLEQLKQLLQKVVVCNLQVYT